MSLLKPWRPSRPRAAPLFNLRAIFFVNGFLFASWVPLIPYIQHRYTLSPAALGWVLAALTLGGVAGLLGVNLARSPRAERWVFAGTVLATALSLAVIGSLPSLMALVPAIMAFGAGLGAMDVAMNRLGSDYERALARPIMSGLHALFSVGGALGGIGVGSLLVMGASPALAAVLVAGVASCGLPLAWQLRLPAAQPSSPALVFKALRPMRFLVLLALVALALEAVMIDWVGLYLTSEFKVGRAPASAGYVVFALALTLSRFCGDSLVQAFGVRRVLTVSISLAVVGVTAVAAAPSAGAVLAAVAAAGLGLGNGAPLLFSLAGKQGAGASSAAISAVVTAGYTGFMAAPPVMGALVEGMGYRRAMLCFAVSALLALWLWRRRPGD